MNVLVESSPGLVLPLRGERDAARGAGEALLSMRIDEATFEGGFDLPAFTARLRTPERHARSKYDGIRLAGGHGSVVAARTAVAAIFCATRDIRLQICAVQS